MTKELLKIIKTIGLQGYKKIEITCPLWFCQEFFNNWRRYHRHNVNIWACGLKSSKESKTFLFCYIEGEESIVDVQITGSVSNSQITIILLKEDEKFSIF